MSQLYLCTKKSNHHHFLPFIILVLMEVNMQNYIQSFIPESMKISHEATEELTKIITCYTSELTKEVLDVQKFETNPKNMPFNVELILRHNNIRIIKNAVKHYQEGD